MNLYKVWSQMLPYFINKMLLEKVIGLSIIALASAELHFSIYKLDCIKEQDTNYTKNISCFLKTIARGLNVLTSLSDLVRPLHYINMNVVTFQKSSANSYRTVVHNNSFEVCAMMGGDAPPLFKLCIPLLTKFSPQFLHPCPYEGRRVGVENIPIDFSLLPLVQLSAMPRGDYRTDINFYDKYWNTIHWIKLYGAIQQKRFSRKHLGQSTTTSPSTDDTTVG